MIAKIIKGSLYYWCEGCKHAHHVPFDKDSPHNNRYSHNHLWEFNGDINNPSISPSVRHFYTHPETHQQVTICHYWIKNGEIEYCGDCEHEYKGTTRKMTDIPSNYGLPE